MAIHGLWKLHRKSSMKMKEIHQFLEDLFHGNEKTGVVSQVHQVVNGLAPYDKLYNRQNDLIVNSSVDSTSSAVSLVLKPELTQTDVVYISGRDITQKLLECTTFTGPDLMRGRKLYNDGKGAMLNIRKALALLKELPEVTFVDDELVYKSGVTPEEVKEKLLDSMYKLLKGKTTVDKNKKTNKNTTGTTKTGPVPPEYCPYGWFFQGWMAFVIFGPFAEAKDQLDLMYLGPHSDDAKPSTSRRALCKEEQKAKELKRDANIGIYNEEVKRGISTTAQINMATLEVRRNELEMRRMEMAQQIKE
jgi:hypothetical protein